MAEPVMSDSPGRRGSKLAKGDSVRLKLLRQKNCGSKTAWNWSMKVLLMAVS